MPRWPAQAWQHLALSFVGSRQRLPCLALALGALLGVSPKIAPGGVTGQLRPTVRGQRPGAPVTVRAGRRDRHPRLARGPFRFKG